MDPIVKIFPFFSALKRAVPGEIYRSPAAKDQKKKETDQPQTIEPVSSQIQEDLGLADFKLNFSIDPATQTVVVKVIDAKTGKIVREIPLSELLALAKSMKELEGLLFDENI